jgi:uncharacterized membrane protein YeaQ/YmgE (transglycosylase-associated protein family)
MWIMHFLLYLVVAGVCGFIASQLTGAKRINIIGLVLLGLVGAYIGGWVAGFFHLPPIFTVMVAGRAFPVVWAIGGAALVVALYSMISQH